MESHKHDKTLPPAAFCPLPVDRQRFRRRLLDWYRRYGRDLPWRQTRDRSRILVSEVMLQQTQVDRVLPKSEEWLQKYPTLEALAAAPETDVSHTWRPLGYNIRPKRLHAIARESMVRYGGQLPSDEATLLSFKGIGEYTAGAVLSFAFGQRAAILDTNVARVLFRVFIGRGDAKSHAMRRHLWDIFPRRVSPTARLRLQSGLDGLRGHAVHGAQPEMSDLSDAPQLHGLPVQSRARAGGSVMSSPRIMVTAAVVKRDHQFLVTRRLRGTHLAGYWEFPGGQRHAGEELEACLHREIAEELGARLRVGEEIHQVAHEYPERIVELHFSGATCSMNRGQSWDRKCAGSRAPARNAGLSPRRRRAHRDAGQTSG